MVTRRHMTESPSRPSRISDEIIAQLRRATGDVLISIYLPTHTQGGIIGQDRIRLSKGIVNCDRLMEAAGWKPRERQSILSRAQGLVDSREFWRYQDSGLAVFVHFDGALLSVALPGGAPERTTVSTVFHIRPLLPSIEAEYPVLVLTKGGVTLYRSSMHRISRIEGDLPGSFDEINWFVDREKQRQQHPNRAGLAKSGHGHEGGTRAEDLARYLRSVAQTVAKLTGDECLVVLGDDDLTDRFTQITTQDAATPRRSGVADPENPSEVHKKAAPTIAELGRASTERMAESARQSLGANKAMTDLQTALTAAAAGRLDHVLIHSDARPLWGQCDPELTITERHPHQGPFSDDLLDRLVAMAMDTGALISPMDEPIEGHAVVAIPRF